MSGNRLELPFEVYPEHGEPWRVTAQARDLYVWEKTTRDAALSQLSGKDASVGAWYRVAHIAARRQGMFNGTFDEFVETHDVTVIDEAKPNDEPPDETDGLDPTHAAR